jgi:diguanylate cyclase (GGDEF)-like protein/PAS domain S-box-containing protein
MRSELLKEHDNQYQQNIAAELVYLLYSQAKPAIIGSLFVATFLTYSLYHVVPDRALFGWFGLMVTMTVMRYWLVKMYLKARPVAADNKMWWKLFVCMTGFAGVSWSLAGAYLMPGNDIHQTFIACSLAGVSAGAIPFFSGSRVACAVFVIPVLMPFAMWCFIQNDITHNVLGLLTISYLFLLLISCFRTHKVIYNAVKLKFENDALVLNLTSTQNQMVIINNSLQAAATERKHAEELLRESEEQYRLVTDALPVMIAYIHNDMVFGFNNKAYESWFEKPLSEITGKHVADIFNPETYAVFLENYAKLKNNKPYTFETIIQFHDRDECYVSITMIPHIKDNAQQGIFMLISDMTPRINYLATHDALTDLPNRSLFTARFSQALKHAEINNTRVAVLFLDLDNFKNINDTQGHDIGDMLLISVANRVKKCLRNTDTLARLGGDEFTIVLEDISHDNLIKVSTKICESFTEPFQLPNHEVFITTSIGISVYPTDGKEMQGLIKNADMAIYRAKERGKNRFEFYTPIMNEHFQRKITLETNLRTALENNELNVFYQPVIDIGSNTITSLEALLRWENPLLGSISPVEFIPVAEESGLIVSIGEWVIRQVCEQNLIWQKSTLLPQKLRVAVNLSARQFRETTLVDQIVAILTETGMSGEYLTLEITESLIMQEMDSSIKVLKKLKDLGIIISIDDFGTGYSSLNYLRRFPIDIIKIDRSFITDIDNDDNSADAIAIITAIIALSHSLKMKVIAEGVETIPQYNLLRSLDCDQIQGFLISRPVPVQEITAFLQRAFSYDNYLKFRRFDKDYADKRWEEFNSKPN